MQMVLDFPVNPRYSFDNFVICGGNETAYRFALMLGRENTSNLLYIYGPAGSGKTHLLAAIGKSLSLSTRENKAVQISYISFRDIDLMYDGEYPAEEPSRIAERLRGAPALLIDDIHLIPDNASIKVELWQVFNDFFNSGRKIAITGLYPPKELPNLDDHLISRLLWGLVARVDISDDDSRRLIMKKLAEDRQIILPAEVIDYILVHSQRDIPSLIEAFEALRRQAIAAKRKITLRLAREVLTSGIKADD
jgi:chromosomal replication initiator protein